MKTRPQKSFFGSRKPTHGEQIRQLVAENTMLKMKLESASKEQRSVEYWKSVVIVVSAEMQKFDQSSIKEDTPYSEVAEAIAKKIVENLEKAEKNMEKKLQEGLKQEKQEKPKEEGNAETEQTI